MGHQSPCSWYLLLLLLTSCTAFTRKVYITVKSMVETKVDTSGINSIQSLMKMGVKTSSVWNETEMRLAIRK